MGLCRWRWDRQALGQLTEAWGGDAELLVGRDVGGESVLWRQDWQSVECLEGNARGLDFIPKVVRSHGEH